MTSIRNPKSHMTAADILSSYRAARPVLHDYLAWLTLLTIAEAGPPGIYRSALERAQRPLRARRAREWQAAGLIRIDRVKGRGGPPAIRITITRRGLELLQLVPAPAAAAVSAPAQPATVTPE